MDRTYTIFEHELSTSINFPFRSIFEYEPFKGYLFEEFRLAELKPCVWLYREQHYSQQEYEKIIAEKNAKSPVFSGKDVIAAPFVYSSEDEKKLNSIHLEFFEKQARNTLDSRFFCPDILKTPTALILSKIETALYFLKEPDFNNEKLEFYVGIISGHLKAILKVDLRNAVLEKLIDDELNFKAIWQEDNGVSFAKWKKNKFEFDYLLKKYFPDEKYPENKDGVRADHSDLLNALSKYVTGITPIEFTNIIEQHPLTPNTKKAKWTGNATDAHRFATYTQIKVAGFNKYFDGVMVKGNFRPLRNNDKEKDEKTSFITEILEKHLKK